MIISDVDAGDRPGILKIVYGNPVLEVDIPSAGRVGLYKCPDKKTAFVISKKNVSSDSSARILKTKGLFDVF